MSIKNIAYIKLPKNSLLDIVFVTRKATGHADIVDNSLKSNLINTRLHVNLNVDKAL